MLATNETTLSFEKAIEEINAIIKLAGLSWGYSLWDKTWEKHNMEIFLAAPKKPVPNFAANWEDDEDKIFNDNMAAMLADDFTHLTSFIGIFWLFMIKASGAVKNPSTTFDLLYDRMSTKLKNVANGAAVQFGTEWIYGKNLHKDTDIQTAANLVKDIAKVFDKYHS